MIKIVRIERLKLVLTNNRLLISGFDKQRIPLPKVKRYFLLEVPLNRRLFPVGKHLKDQKPKPVKPVIKKCSKINKCTSRENNPFFLSFKREKSQNARFF